MIHFLSPILATDFKDSTDIFLFNQMMVNRFIPFESRIDNLFGHYRILYELYLVLDQSLVEARLLPN